MKRCVLAWLAVFVTWFLLDGLGHGWALSSLYAQTPQVWRPRGEMKVGLIYTGVAITAAAFVAIYAQLIAGKSVRRGIAFGALFGLASACAIAFGGYAVHPIPVTLAVGWFAITLIEATVAGALVGSIVRDGTLPPSAARMEGP